MDICKYMICLFYKNINLFNSPIAAIMHIFAESYNLSHTPVIRTAGGEQMAEYVYGMKNFLHDFSSLS
jgi:hypothetical protein